MQVSSPAQPYPLPLPCFAGFIRHRHSRHPRVVSWGCSAVPLGVSSSSAASSACAPSSEYTPMMCSSWLMLLATSIADPEWIRYMRCMGERPVKSCPMPEFMSRQEILQRSQVPIYTATLLPLERHAFLFAILQTARAESGSTPSKDLVMVRVGLYRCDLGRMHWRYSICMS